LSTPATFMLELVGVTKGFAEGGRQRPVLDGVDLAVEAGTRVAITGRSGSGKSTLLNLASGIDLPDRGGVRIAGIALEGLPDRERTLLRRRRVGFVFQFFNLIPTLTVAENVLLPLSLNRIPREEASRRVEALLERVGLGDRAESFPDRLSGGEQQRVAIARALVHEPDLVLADEPTGNLDAATGRQVLELLGGLAGEGGRTLVLVTHSAEATAVADRVLHLESGRLGEPEGEP
jgi:putative ABC transport system ATP-binding protein